MANVTIPNLPAVIGLDGTEQLECVQGGTSKRVTTDQIADYTRSATFPASMQVLFDYGARVVESGVQGYMRVPFNCTLDNAIVLADQSGTVSVDIWKCTYAQFDAGSTHPVIGDSITGGNPIALSAATKASSNLSGWTTALTEGDVLAFYVPVTATSITQITVALGLLRSFA